MKEYLTDFKKIYKPTKEIEQWIYWDIEMDKAINLLEFTKQYKTKNKLPQTWMPSKDYYDFMSSPLSMDKSALTNSKATRWFINKYLFEYVYPRTIIDIESKSIIGKLLVASKGIDASLLENIKALTENNALLRQLCYSAFFNEELDKNSIENYEDNKKLIQQNITEPFLKYPLIANYVNTKTKIDTPLNLTDFKTSSVKDTDLNSFLEDIKKNYQDKLLYIDVWATWCSPCIEEMKKSKEIHEQLKVKGVECIFVCIDSEKDKCDTALAELDLKGQFYFLSKKQSNLLREKFSISGIPHYLLIDKTGNIIDSGSHLRPSGQIIMNRIEENL
jgi:thiol-disulfide isomerase/thioredoxin